MAKVYDMMISSQRSSLLLKTIRARNVYMAKLKIAKIVPIIANLPTRTEVVFRFFESLCFIDIIIARACYNIWYEKGYFCGGASLQ